MKKLFLALGLISLNYSFAQFVEEPKNKTWYHDNLAITKVYGVNTNNAYQFFESKGLKPQSVIVGVIDSGVEVNHSGLKKNIWINTKEIEGNGIDDDHNGYIDDIHGWNFLGGTNGDISVDNLEVTRVVREYSNIFEGSNYEKNKANMAKMSIEYEMYKKAKQQFDEKSVSSQKNFKMYSTISERMPVAIAMLKGKKFTEENINALVPTDSQEAQNISLLKQFINIPDIENSSPTQANIKIQKELKGAIDYYGDAAKQYDLSFDPRKIVGDNYADYNEKYYGNNHYEGPDAKHGTHVAGIIAGLPNAEGQYGIANKVAKIMTIRAVPNGDERDKDVANAIRYAVDNGAKILNMSFGKPISPGKTYVWEALKYAETKGVLLVKAAGNEGQNIEKFEYFPTNFKNQSDAKAFIKNMIVVGASTMNNTALNASFSNYNPKMVDVFAPGEGIYSTIPKNQYEYLDGTSMASPVVAGASAVLLAYLPHLTPEQIIESLVKTVNKNTTSTGMKENYHFSQMSRAGGIIDLKKAAEYAYTNFGGNQKTKPTKIKASKNKMK